MSKRRHYEQQVHICEVEHATLTPLVMSSSGGMCRAASVISEKSNVEYSKTINWIWCRLSFALLQALVMSIRAARSFRHYPAPELIHAGTNWPPWRSNSLDQSFGCRSRYAHSPGLFSRAHCPIHPCSNCTCLRDCKNAFTFQTQRNI